MLTNCLPLSLIHKQLRIRIKQISPPKMRKLVASNEVWEALVGELHSARGSSKMWARKTWWRWSEWRKTRPMTICRRWCESTSSMTEATHSSWANLLATCHHLSMRIQPLRSFSNSTRMSPWIRRKRMRAEIKPSESKARRTRTRLPRTRRSTRRNDHLPRSSKSTSTRSRE